MKHHIPETKRWKIWSSAGTPQIHIAILPLSVWPRVCQNMCHVRSFYRNLETITVKQHIKSIDDAKQRQNTMGTSTPNKSSCRTDALSSGHRMNQVKDENALIWHERTRDDTNVSTFIQSFARWFFVPVRETCMWAVLWWLVHTYSRFPYKNKNKWCDLAYCTLPEIPNSQYYFIKATKKGTSVTEHGLARVPCLTRVCPSSCRSCDCDMLAFSQYALQRQGVTIDRTEEMSTE